MAGLYHDCSHLPVRHWAKLILTARPDKTKNHLQGYPGWEKKLKKCEVVPVEVYQQCHPLPPEAIV